MAVNQIPVATTTPWGALTLQYRQQLLAYRQQQAVLQVAGAALLAKLTAMVDGSDYTRLESQLSLQTGQGTLLYAQLNSVVGHLATPTDSQATVNAAVDQFNGYIG